MVDGIIKKMTHIHNTIGKMNETYIELWKEDMFLTWRWWLNTAILILPWIIWLIVRKKKSTNRLLLSGLFVYLITSVLNTMGVAFGLWFYSYTPLPYIHSFFMPWDFGAFPVMVMLLIQYKPNISPYLKALLFAVFSAILFEPLFEWMKLYLLLNWKHYYGVPIYFLIYILAHRVSRRHHFEPIE